METKPNGLKYEDVEMGSGAQAERGKTISVHYTGWLGEAGKKGKKFDSSRDRDEPFEFELGAGMVIKGWDQGFDGMKEGGKRTLYIPYELGYGENGYPAAEIPPKAELIFDVELLEVR